jgi:hypothetical protein
MANNIWIDLTDLFAWEGNFTGVQRVAYNYAERYSKEGANYFIYLSHNNRFKKVPFDIMQKDFPKQKAVLRKKVKKHLKKYYSALPNRIQKISDPVARKTLHRYRKILAKIFLKVSRRRLLKRYPTAQFGSNDVVLLLGAVWNENGLVDKLIDQKGEVGFSVVVHLNDILPIYQPQLFADKLPKMFAEYVSKALKIADGVTVISKATQRDIARYCRENKFKEPNTKVVRLGEDGTKVTSVEPISTKLDDVFVLSVGTFEVRKNYNLLYQVVKLAKLENTKLPQIVIVGRKGWLAKDLLYIIKNDPEVKDCLTLLDNMTDHNLAWLYDNCLFTIFPSLCEGWGLPVAESLHHGKLCLSSNTSSMPEIAGDLIDYFSPFDSRQCLNKILEYSQKDLADINSRIKKQYKPHTWDHSFEELKSFIDITVAN